MRRISSCSAVVPNGGEGNVRPRGAHAGSRGSRRYTLKGSMMADGWAHDGAVQEQIEDTVADAVKIARSRIRSEEHTSELQSLMRISYAVFCLKKKTQHSKNKTQAT